MTTPPCPRFLRTLTVRPGPARGGEPTLVFEDASGFSPHHVVLWAPLGALLLELLDGTRDREAVLRDWHGATGQPLAADQLARWLGVLDDALLLEGGKAAAARRDALAAWRGRSSRPPLCAGSSYAGDAAVLAADLAAWRRASGVDPVPPGVRAVLAPHIDPRGGGPCHGAAAAALAACPADVYVVLGTAHHALERPFALTALDFDTPAGRVRVDGDLVRRLDRRGGGDLLGAELAHAGEHSVEFQAVWLKLVHADRPALRIVPVLVGSLGAHLHDGRPPGEDPAVADFVAALREVLDEGGPRVALVASVDFAHVGPMYGQPESPDAAALERVMEADRRLLEHVVALDAGGWFRFLHDEQDARNVCGAAPTWVLLEALRGRPLEGRVLRHDCWEIDAESGSHVSFAAAAWHDAAPTTSEKESADA